MTQATQIDHAALGQTCVRSRTIHSSRYAANTAGGDHGDTTEDGLRLKLR
jgi:hypothetical protein